MTFEDLNDDLAWRNLVADWHLRQGMPGCGCDDDTADGDFCADSKAWADDRFAARPDPRLDGPPDPWNHDVWIASWGHNAPLIASDNDFRVPSPPTGMSWLLTRMLVGGRQAIELSLVRLHPDRLQTIATARLAAEPSTVIARARGILRELLQ